MSTPPDLQTKLAFFLRDLYNGTVTFTGQSLAGAGTSALPAYSFTAEPTLGFYRLAATRVGVAGGLTTTTSVTATTGMGVGATAYYNFIGRGYLQAPANGMWNLQNEGLTTGATLKFDALPTIASGFGTGAAVTAGSTPLAGSVVIGTGSPLTGVITFGGTAFPSAPFAVVSQSVGTGVLLNVPSTTQLTITTSVAWASGTVVSWLAISAK